MTIDNSWVIYGAPVTTKSGVGFLNGFISLEYVLKKMKYPVLYLVKSWAFPYNWGYVKRVFRSWNLLKIWHFSTHIYIQLWPYKLYYTLRKNLLSSILGTSNVIEQLQSENKYWPLVKTKNYIFRRYTPLLPRINLHGNISLVWRK